MQLKGSFLARAARAALLTLPLAWSLPAGDVRGVIEGPGGSTVQGVRVELLGRGPGVRTDAFGAFEITSVPAGSYSLIATSDAFEPVEQQVDVPAEGAVELQLRFAQLSSLATRVEVIGRSEDVLHEIPGSVFTIAAEEIEVSVPLDANEVLRRVPACWRGRTPGRSACGSTSASAG